MIKNINKIMNLQYIRERLDAWERLTRLDKPIGTLLLLWPTLWAVWIASRGTPEPMLVWIYCLGTLLMRSAGCIMNDLADRKFDGHVHTAGLPGGGVRFWHSDGLCQLPE